jgi:hypothetical protein
MQVPHQSPQNFDEWHDGVDPGPDFSSQPPSEAEVLDAIRFAEPMAGLDAALRLAAESNTPKVRKLLFERASQAATDPIVRVNMAALLYFLCGKSNEPFDWAMRPVFLQFGEGEPEEVHLRATQELRRLVESHE